MTLLETLTTFVSTNYESISALLSGLAAAGIHYSRTGKLPLGRLPWRAAKGILRDLREQYYRKRRPRGVPGLVISESLPELEATLRERHFEGAPTTYLYEGEDLNLRRPAGTERHPDTGEDTPMELHVRAFEAESGEYLLLTHYEASRYEAPGVHLDSTLYSWKDGREMMAGVLDSAGISYRAVASERDTDIEVL